MTRTRIVMAVCAATALASPLAAQLRFGASGEAMMLQHRVFAGSGVELSSGSLYGAAFTGAVGTHVEFGLDAASGRLTRDSGAADNATLARAEGHVAILPVPWLALRAGLGIHTFSNAVAVQRWTSLRVGAEGRLNFVGDKLTGLVRFELFPFVDVSGLEHPNRAFGAASGLQFHSGIVIAEVAYTFERYDFAAVAGVERKEQLSALTASLGITFGRGQ